MTSLKPIIPYGYCHCGCAQQTTIISKTYIKRGLVKGQPHKFIYGHHTATHRPPIRYGILDHLPVAYIPLTKGYWTVVDRIDVHKIQQYRWKYSNGYAAHQNGHDGDTILLHRFLMNFPPSREVDHENGNKLDNRRSKNLRIAPTNNHNKWNTGLRRTNKSGYKGVCWVTKDKRWRAAIRVGNGLRITIGHFAKDKLIEAAKAYDTAAIKYHGKFARLNFPVNLIEKQN